MGTAKRRRGGRESERNQGRPKTHPRLRFRLEDLETFLAVAETGSFSRAAEHLGLSQPSVTSRVQRLENSVGIPLLQRTTRRVEITGNGARFKATADAALRDLRDLLREFRGEAEARKKRMTLAATPLVAAVALMPIIRRYNESEPGIEIRLHDVRMPQALNELAAGIADMAILVFDDNHPDFRFEPLTVEECVVVTPPNHPLLAKPEATVRAIAKFRVLLPDSYRSVRDVLELEYEKRRLAFEPIVLINEVSNISTVIGMVAAGMGITFVPRTLISGEQRGSVGMVRSKGFRVERRYGIVTARDKPMAPIARSFARFVRSSIPPGGTGWSD
jgi:LysR family carnitine catabolism transcriptional activator